MAIGAGIVHQNSVESREPKLQLSYRRAVLNCLEYITGGRAKIEYVDIRCCNANDIFEIGRIVDMVEQKNNPHDANMITPTGMVGDQPVCKMLFKIWLDAYVSCSCRRYWRFMENQ